MCGGDPGEKSRRRIDPRMNDEEIRLSVVHLLRAYFDKSADVDPLNDERVVDISHDHISALADIILYTSNPILYRELKEKTRNDAVTMLTNSALRFKLPESLMCMIAYRHSQTDIMNNEIVKIADDIVFTAKKNEEFYHKKRDGLLEWGRCPEEDIYNRYNNALINPNGIEGWVPAVIEYQDIWIKRDQFDMYPGRWDRDDSKVDAFAVYLHGNHNNHLSRYVTRDLLKKPPSFYGIPWIINENENDENDWIKVKLTQQRTWIYYDLQRLSILPKSSNPDSYIKVTLTASFPNSRACTFFAERNPQGSIFVDYPADIFSPRPLFIDEDAPAPPPPDFTRQIIVVGSINNRYLFHNTYDNDHENYEPLPTYIYWRMPYEISDERDRIFHFEDLLKIFDKSPFIDREKTFLSVLNQITRSEGDPHRGLWIIWNTEPLNNGPRKYILLSDLILIYNYASSNYEFIPNTNMIININECITQLLLDFDSISINATSMASTEARIESTLTTSERTEAQIRLALSEERALARSAARRRREAGIIDDEEEDTVIEPVYVRPRQRVRAHVPSINSKKLPMRIRDIIVADIISKGDECSITMEPLTAENLAITSCFHFFEKTAINKWISENHTCPQCRERTTLFA